MIDQETLDKLIPLAIREFETATGGHQLPAADAAAIIRDLLSGRAVSSPAAYLVRAIRDAPDPFALIPGAEPAAPAHRGGHPSARTVAEALGPVYAARAEQVRAYYAEDARRKNAGLPLQWQERDARLRAIAAEQADEHRRHDDILRPVETVLLPGDELPPAGSDEPPF